MATGLIALAVTLGVALTTGLAWQRSSGRVREVRTGASETTGASRTMGSGPVLTAAQLGQPLGARATLVQFSTAFCAPCRATRRILAEVAGMVNGVAHVEIDAEAHLDLVRSLDIRRTPTVLVLSQDGTVTRRASGQPRRADVIAALGEVV